LVLWAPIFLDNTISGDKVNEVERIRILSKRFCVYAFALVSVEDLPNARVQIRRWFGKTRAKITVIPALNRPGFRIVSSILAAAMAIPLLLLLRIVGDIDLVISRDFISTIPFLSVCRLARVKCLYNVLSVPLGSVESQILGNVFTRAKLARFALGRIDWFVVQKADYIGVVDPETNQQLGRWYGIQVTKKVVFLPFPIPDGYYELPVPRKNRKVVTAKLIYYGSVNDLYDFSSLLEALNTFGCGEKDVVLEVYTTPQGKRKLETTARGLANVRFKAQVPRKDIARIIRTADAVVIPLSRSAPGLALKSIEAMALGIPVIIANAKNRALYRDNETCFAVKDDTPESWQDAMSRSLDTTSRERVIAAARKQVEAFRASANLMTISALLRKDSVGASQLQRDLS
jgi:glycosyltransferase involved in cell wall biosynthesis